MSISNIKDCKVAVCIAGQAQELGKRDAISHLNDVFNFCIKDINPDVYIHTYECNEKNKIIDFYKPKKYIFEDNSVYMDPVLALDICDVSKYKNHHIHTMVFNFFAGWRKKKLVFDMLDQQYDVVLITRFDSYGKVSIADYLSVKESVIRIPCGGDYEGGLNDLCAWGRQNEMKYYCSLYDNIDYHYNNGKMIHAESFLRYHLDANKDISVERVLLPMALRGGDR